ncbi:MAG: efflux RND transporter permease subunit [Ignavibacteriae bacterium]|nr:efflux RND transporter permease subunit [Ignavibacteriota bacterium]
MLNKIIQFSLKNRMMVVAGAALALVYGVMVVLKLPVDVLPDLNKPTVTILTEAGGLAPEEVEALVTLPLETVMNGAAGVQRVRSFSSAGLSIVFVEFDWGTDIFIDRQIVNEKLQLASAKLPPGVIPVMGPISSIMGQIMLIGMAADSTSPMELRTLADWVVRQRLLTIPGVAQVIPIGGEVKQYQVLLDPLKMQGYNVSQREVEEAMAQSNLNTTGGFTFSQNQEYLIRNIGRTVNIDDIGNAVVSYRNGTPILLKQIGTVRLGPPIKRGDGGMDAKPAVILGIEKQPNANTVQLTEQIEKALKEIQPSLPPDVKIQTNIFKQKNFIEAAIGNVEEALRDGAILVAIVLFLFLLNFRTTAITLTAIPLSLIITAFVFKWFDITINTMTLGGLAVAIGELVDDAIVDVENVFRRLKENRSSAHPKPTLQVIYSASSEVRNSIVFATIIVILVFIPLFSLSGVEGKIFAPLGIAYIISIAASLLVSLTVTPALCSYLLPKAKVLTHKEDGFLVRWLKKQDTRLLHWTLEHPNKVMTAAGGLFVAALLAVPFLGTEFLPPFNEGSLTVNVVSVPGTSLAESNRIGIVAETLIRNVPEVLITGRRTGRAELDEHAEGVHYSEIDVELRESDRSREEILNDVRKQLGQIPGVVLNIGQPISHRIDHLLSGVRAQIAVKIFGADLDELRKKAEEVRAQMEQVKGVVDLQIEKQVLIPQMRIKIKREEALRYGFKVGEIAEALETAFNGKVVGQVLEEQRTFDMVVRYDDAYRAKPEVLKLALLDAPTGAKIPLSAVADVIDDKGPNLINHENVQRRIVISSNVSDRDLGTVVAEIQNRVAQNVKLGQGSFITYGGQFESQQEATRLIGILSLFSLAAMFLVLYTHFKSARVVIQILLNIPLALIGSVAAVYLTGGVMSIATLVGFITLTGIASRNGIMMISHYIHLVEHEGEHFDKKMIVRGSLERLVPVLMTALTAGLALIPLVLAAGQPGKEILYPVAVVILGGLLSSTLLDMAVTPAVFWKFGRPAVEKFLKAHEENAFAAEGEHPTDAHGHRANV